MNRSSFALRRGATLSLTLGLAIALAACGGGGTGSPGASDDTTGGGTVAVVDGSVDLSANDLEFDANVIQAPAGEEFTISFTNNESQPHNVVILTEEGGDEIARTEVLTGPDASETLTVPTLEAGEYYFFCEIHPDMEGTIVVEG